MTSRKWMIIAAAVVVIGAGGYLAYAGLGAPVSVVDDRSEAAARKTAQAASDAYAAGDWAGAWDYKSKQAKAAISRADYERWLVGCDKLSGPKFEIKTVRVEGDKATVTTERLGIALTDHYVFEDHAWRLAPDAAALASYAKGVDALIAECKKG